MPKKFSQEPIFIENIESLKKAEKQLYSNQSIQFNCSQCNILTERKLQLMKRNNYTFLCRNCLQKQTNLKKFGTENPSQSSLIKEKKKQTCLKHYGVTNPTYIKNHNEKVKQTCLKKYGVTHPNKDKSIKEKSKQTCLEKYGVENPSQVDKFKEKKKQTFLKRYDCLNPMQCQSVKNKVKQTLFQKYGVYHTLKRSYVFEQEQFDSSWELAVWIWAKNLKKNIVREPVYFKYLFENEIHLYYPDFEIEGQLVEIKGPQFFKKDGTMQNPYDHSLDGIQEAKHQCGLKNGVQFWKEKEMEPILKHVKTLYGKNWLKKFKN